MDEDDGAPWDFDNPRERAKALDRVRREQFVLLVGSPMCTAFSAWQRINSKVRDPEVFAVEKARALVHLSFCTDLYREQAKNGHYWFTNIQPRRPRGKPT